MKIHYVVLGSIALLSSINAQTFSIDFRDGTWMHDTPSGVVISHGWGKPSNTTQGYTQGISEVAPGTFLTVKTQFFGTASAGADNFRLDPSNTPGFAFQNAGTGDTNFSVDSNGNTILQNYQRIDFSFSTAVLLDSLRILDIDTASSTGATTQAWRDTVAVELWNGSGPLAPGLNIDPSITLPGSPSRLLQGVTSNGLPYAYANTLGNTSTSNPGQPNDPSSAVYSLSTDAVDGFSLYLWNRGRGSGGKHAVVLQASGSQLRVVPEPSSLSLFAITISMIALRRSRRASI
ncbi:hypothetical protein NT6N_30330 [Oceaniferula spumae]|uniref:PEP-CTERM sorting domain-containing protein n=1 Tax=Oceaniferula spumae TaxID=2979115 RepID=A0AAT9FPW7_9BACT